MTYLSSWLRRFLPLLLGSLFLAATQGAEPILRTWTVDGLRRGALVYTPAQATEAPVVFVFHGHGGTMQHAARVMALQSLWPEAVVVYMQGLPTAAPMVDPDGRFPGWQLRPAAEGDRDLHFFDAVLTTVEHDYHADPKRVFATGHSNGGIFTYVLLAARPEAIAAFAPSAAIAPLGTLRVGHPKPVLHLAGKQDALVRFEWQQRTMDAVRRLNGAEFTGQPWGESGNLIATIYPSQTGTPLIAAIHPGGHQFPDGAAGLIVRFFKEQNAR